MIPTADSSHMPLVEQLSEELIRRSWWSFITWYGIPTSAFCLLPLVLATVVPREQPVGSNLLAGVLLTAGMLVPLTASLFLAANGIHQWLREHPLSVRLNSNMLTVESRDHIVSIDVRDCEIRQDYAIYARNRFVPKWLRLYCWTPALLIYLPPFQVSITGGFTSRDVIAVGLDEQSRAKWENALAPWIGKSRVSPLEPTEEDHA